jgi:hypothetical protein
MLGIQRLRVAADAPARAWLASHRSIRQLVIAYDVTCCCAG